MAVDVLARNHVTVRGQGAPPMLFAHGFGCDQNMWRHLAPAFETDHQVVLFDYVGGGRSDVRAYDPERYSSLAGYAQDLLDVCHALNLQDTVVVAHSVSCMAALLAALQEPERFRRLVFIGPSPRYLNDSPDYVGGFERADIEGLLDTMDRNYIGWASALGPTVMRNPDRPELTAELVESFCSTDPTIARRFAEVTFLSDNRDDLPRLTVPALVLQCADDLIAPREVGEYVHRMLPQSTFHALRATGHCPHLSHPDETIAAIRAYLAMDSVLA